MDRVSSLKCENVSEIKGSLAELLNIGYTDLFPKDNQASILIKPNLNSNMNALTGNTTDLRLLAAIVEYLNDKGYKKITIGEGTNSGFFRAGVNVIRRLRVDELARYYGINVVDFNCCAYETIELEDGIKANIARECLESDFFINVPKLKTHFETEMTMCLKSLIGCLVGRENKKKVHTSLIKNILKLNEAIKPDLQIIDGLIAMEGTGPSLGEPKKIDTILIGTDPYLLDMVASKIAGYDDFLEIPVLKEAFDQGKIGEAQIQEYREADVRIHEFKRPDISFLVRMTINPNIQKYLIKIRYAPLINRTFNWELTRKLLFSLGISQDFIVFQETDISYPFLSKSDSCKDGCTVCQDVCPLGNDLPALLSSGTGRECLKCLYCYAACPESKIEVNGDLGFFQQQRKQYDESIRKVFGRKNENINAQSSLF